MRRLSISLHPVDWIAQNVWGMCHDTGKPRTAAFPFVELQEENQFVVRRE